jgi:group II intron reverse transcriptase/maturase
MFMRKLALLFNCVIKRVPLIASRNLASEAGIKAGCGVLNYSKSPWRATFGTDRLTNLIHRDGTSRTLVHYQSGDSTCPLKTDSRNRSSFRTTFGRQSNSLIPVIRVSMQSPNPNNYGIYRTSGSPKERKFYGDRASIVVAAPNGAAYKRRREAGYWLSGRKSFFSSGVDSTASGCDRLLNLREVNGINPNLLNKKTIHIISDMEVLTLAYELIKSNPGNMTRGSSPETLDGIGLAKLKAISGKLKAGTFDFSPARRVFIPKAGGSGKRPLSVVNPREKIVQKAIQLTLEAIYEPCFLSSSHGFRPQRGCHTALKLIKYGFRDMSWVVDADIEGFFDNVDHKTLLDLLRTRIECDKTVALVKRSLEAGFMVGGAAEKSRKGTPQGSILSPLLGNIVLHELDKFMLQLKDVYRQGKNRRVNPEHRRYEYLIQKTECAVVKRRLRRDMWKVKYSKDPMDPSFRRLNYVRYADDFIVGVIGPLSEVKLLQKQISEFLEGSLKLNLNLEKTKLVDFGKDTVNFLGTQIRGSRKKFNKPIITVKSYGQLKKVIATPRTNLDAPLRSMFAKAKTNGFFKQKGDAYYPTAVKRLVNLDHADILGYYNQVSRGILNYYSFTDNHARLGTFVHRLKHSCALTLALKYKLRTMGKTFAKFGKTLDCPVTGVQFRLEPSYKKSGRFLINPSEPSKVLAKRWNAKLTKSSLHLCCLVCGGTKVEMHHVRRIRDLQQKYAKGKIDFWTKQLAAINRKQIPLCKDHHMQLHHGKLSDGDREKLKVGIRNFNRKKPI